MVITTEGFFEVAIEIWLQWDLKPRPLNSVQTLKPAELSAHEFNSHLEPTLYSIYRLVSPGGFFRVEEFTDLLVFVNFVYN